MLAKLCQTMCVIILLLCLNGCGPPNGLALWIIFFQGQVCGYP
jgi:hypothetical protein